MGEPPLQDRGGWGFTATATVKVSEAVFNVLMKAGFPCLTGSGKLFR